MQFTKEETMKAKGIAILLLCFYHIFYKINIIENFHLKSILPTDFVIEIIPMTIICGWIFVFLSAYGLSVQFNKKRAEEKIDIWLLKRWFSLMKGYWFVYILKFVFYFCVNQNPLEKYQFNIFYVLADFLGLADYFGTPMLNGLHWYMCLAQMIILLVPLFVLLFGKLGWGMLFFLFITFPFLEKAISSPYGGPYVNYLFVIGLGVVFAECNLFEKLKKKKSIKKYLGAICILICIVLFCYSRYRLLQIVSFDTRRLPSIMFAFAAVLIVVFSFCYCGGILGKILIVLGKHSGNMYLQHTLFITWCLKYLLPLKYMLLISLAVTVLSFVGSIFIEILKKWTRYNYYMERLYSYIEAFRIRWD